MTLQFHSSTYEHNASMPSQFTCQGQDISPALTWMNVPANCQSLAIIIDDPDAPDPQAPKMTWVHWVVYNIPATASSLPQHATATTLPPGTLEGVNDWHAVGYRGPCPPIGQHRYVHKLYALDTVLPNLHHPDKATLETAMRGHIIEHSEFVATYQK